MRFASRLSTGELSTALLDTIGGAAEDALITAPPVITEAEYRARLASVRLRMMQADIGLLVIVDPANMNYLTGYDGWSFYTPQAVIVPLEDEPPTWIGRAQDGPTAHVTCWMDADHIVPYGEAYIGSGAPHAMEAVVQHIRGRGWHRRRIGVETDAYYYTAMSDKVLNRGLPEATFVDAYLLVNWVRAIKSPAELDFVRVAAKLTSNAMRIAVDKIEPGVRQTDLLGEVLKALVTGLDEFGGDYPSSRVHMAAGAWTNQPHAPFRSDPFPSTGAVTLELGATYRRYDAPLARTIHMGRAPRELLDAHEVVRVGLEAALAAVRPGQTCEAVEAAWRSSIAASGFAKASRIGYSIGLGYPPTRIENTMSLRQGDCTVLEPNMTFHMIPGLWLHGFGIELSESFIVTDDGAEVITDFPRELVAKVRVSGPA